MACNHNMYYGDLILVEDKLFVKTVKIMSFQNCTEYNSLKLVETN